MQMFLRSLLFCVEGTPKQIKCNSIGVFISLHFASLHFTSLHCTALHCTALHFIPHHTTAHSSMPQQGGTVTADMPTLLVDPWLPMLAGLQGAWAGLQVQASDTGCLGYLQ